jgi:hypothetical protein
MDVDPGTDATAANLSPFHERSIAVRMRTPCRCTRRRSDWLRRSRQPSWVAAATSRVRAFSDVLVGERAVGCLEDEVEGHRALVLAQRRPAVHVEGLDRLQAVRGAVARRAASSVSTGTA